jgi:hypothetical protein
MSNESMVTQGHAGDAIDFALGHCGPDEAFAFLDDWRANRADEWPGYVKWLSAQYRHQPQREAVLEEGNKRGLYDTTKIGPELVAFLDDRRGMLASLRDEMSEGYRGWLDDAVDALRIASERLAALITPAPEGSATEIAEKARSFAESKTKLLREVVESRRTTPAPAVKPHCSTCGKDVAEVLCETCGKWWADNPPPAPAVSRDDRQSAIAELCEGLREARAVISVLMDTAADFTEVDQQNCEHARLLCGRLEALLSKHSPDALGQHTETRATESDEGDEA